MNHSRGYIIHCCVFIMKSMYLNVQGMLNKPNEISIKIDTQNSLLDPLLNNRRTLHTPCELNSLLLWETIDH